ncbi:hypothetical protein ACMFMG_008620 [Clarireedia jacksonii]
MKSLNMPTKRCLTCIATSSRVAASRNVSVPVTRRNLATATLINGQTKFDSSQDTPPPTTSQPISTSANPPQSPSAETRSINRPDKSSSPAGNGALTKSKKTIAQLDDELRAKMEGREGSAGIEYEGGKPVTDGFKRGVRSNMFRVI